MKKKSAKDWKKAVIMFVNFFVYIVCGNLSRNIFYSRYVILL